MKFSWKLFLWTLSIVAVTLAFGGYYIVNSFFQSSLSRETRQSLEDNQVIRFALETAALNIPSKYEHLQDETIVQIASTLNAGEQNRYIRISDENRSVLYESDNFKVNSILNDVSEKQQTYQITSTDNNYFIQTAIKISISDRHIYLETLKDITNVFTERENGFSVYKQVSIFVLICESIIIYLLSRWLTNPINLLSNATRNMAKGNYSFRAKKISNDELGKLTDDFNQMADSLGNHVEQLQESVRVQEEFVGAFTHELKTPLTAIIGYADMLRSQKMDEEKQIISANYIFQEGRRLEKLSFDLLDIIVLKHSEKPLTFFNTSMLSNYLEETYSTNEVKIIFNLIESSVHGDASLIKTLLINLIDNSIKASSLNDKIEVTGEISGSRYIFTVKDHGCGIPAEHLEKITQAFYMVDKSRTRSHHGAGLGLTLCSEIAHLHDTFLKIESISGFGTKIQFDLEIQSKNNLENRNGDNIE